MRTKVLIHLVPDVPREVERALRPMLKRAEVYLPPWVHTCQIQFLTNPASIESRGMEISTNPDYYSVTIMVHPRWLDYDPEERYRCLVHEIGHAHHADAWHRIRTLTEKLQLEPAMIQWIGTVLRGDFERSAEGFAQMVIALEATGGRDKMPNHPR